MGFGSGCTIYPHPENRSQGRRRRRRSRSQILDGGIIPQGAPTVKAAKSLETTAFQGLLPCPSTIVATTIDNIFLPFIFLFFFPLLGGV